MFYQFPDQIRSAITNQEPCVQRLVEGVGTLGDVFEARDLNLAGPARDWLASKILADGMASPSRKDLLKASPTTVTEAFADDMWRRRYGLTPVTAARFMREYLDESGIVLPFTIFEHAAELTKATFTAQISHTRVALESLARLPGDVGEAARSDLRCPQRIDEALGKAPYASKIALSKVAWPSVAAYLILAVENPTLLDPVHDGTQINVPEASDEIQAAGVRFNVKYWDALRVYLTYLHPQGVQWVEVANTDYASLPANVAHLLSLARKGRPLTRAMVKPVLVEWSKWAYENKQAGVVFKAVLAAWNKGAWATILGLLPDNADVLLPFTLLVEENQSPKDGVEPQTVPDPEAVKVSKAHDSSHIVPIASTESFKTAALIKTPMGIWSVLDFSKSPKYVALGKDWKVAAAVEHSGAIYIRGSNAKGPSDIHDDELAAALLGGDVSVVTVVAGLPGAEYKPSTAASTQIAASDVLQSPSWATSKTYAALKTKGLSASPPPKLNTSKWAALGWSEIGITGIVSNPSNAEFNVLITFVSGTGKQDSVADAILAQAILDGVVTTDFDTAPVATTDTTDELATPTKLEAALSQTAILKNAQLLLDPDAQMLSLSAVKSEGGLPTAPNSSKFWSMPHQIPLWVVGGIKTGGLVYVYIAMDDGTILTQAAMQVQAAFKSGQYVTKLPSVAPAPVEQPLASPSPSHETQIPKTDTTPTNKLSLLDTSTDVYVGMQIAVDFCLNPPEALLKESAYYYLKPGHTLVPQTQTQVGATHPIGTVYSAKSKGKSNIRTIVGYARDLDENGKSSAMLAIISFPYKDGLWYAYLNTVENSAALEIDQDVVDSLVTYTPGTVVVGAPKPAPAMPTNLGYRVPTKFLDVAEKYLPLLVKAPKGTPTVGTTIQLLGQGITDKLTYVVIGFTAEKMLGAFEDMAAASDPKTFVLPISYETQWKYAKPADHEADGMTLYGSGGMAAPAWASPGMDPATVIVGIKQPPFDYVPKDKHVSAGMVAFAPVDMTNMAKPYGVLLYVPSGKYGGYKLCLPKGTVEFGESLESTAVREVQEETGVVAGPIKHLGDYMGGTSINRMYLGQIVGGSPHAAGPEAESVVIARFGAEGPSAEPWWSKLSDDSDKKWVKDAILAGWEDIQANGTVDVQEVEEFPYENTVSVAQGKTIPPWLTPSLMFDDTNPASPTIVFKTFHAVGDHETVTVLDYDVGTSALSGTPEDDAEDVYSVQAYVAAINDQDEDVKLYRLVPYTSEIKEIPGKSLAARGYPPPGRGFLFTDDEGVTATYYTVAYYLTKNLDGSTSITMLVRNRDNDKADESPVYDMLAVYDSVTESWTKSSAFKPLASSAVQAAAALPTDANANFVAVAKVCPFPMPPIVRKALQVAVMDDSSQPTILVGNEIDTFIYTRITGLYYPAGSRFTLYAPLGPLALKWYKYVGYAGAAPTEKPKTFALLGRVTATYNQVNGTKAVRPYYMAISTDGTIGLAIPANVMDQMLKADGDGVTWTKQEPGQASVAGLIPGLLQHKDPAINKRIQQVALGHSLTDVGYNILTFRADLKDAGFEHADVIPEATAAYAASAFLPQALSAAEYMAFTQMLAAIAKAGNKPKPAAAQVHVAPSGAGGVNITSKPITVPDTVIAPYVPPSDYEGFGPLAKAAVKGFANLKPVDIKLGGSNPTQVYEDSEGNRFVVKGAKDGQYDVRTLAEVAGARLMGMVSMDIVPVLGVDIGGNLHSLQPMWKATGKVPAKPSTLSDTDKSRVLVQHALDMFVQDHDGHTSNWVMTDGGLRAIDKGGSFKLFVQGKMPSLDLDYTPGVMLEKAGDVWYSKSLLKAYAADHKTLAPSSFMRLRATIGKLQALSKSDIVSVTDPLLTVIKADDSKRESVVNAIVAWQKDYLKSWTKLLTSLNPDFEWPSKLPLAAPADQVLDATPEAYGFTEVEATRLTQATQARALGRTIRVDRQVVEDQQVMVKSVVYAAAGKGDVEGTLLTWKVTEAAGMQVCDRLSAVTSTPLSAPKVTSAASDPYQGISAMLVDKKNGYYTTILKAVVSVNKRIDKDFTASGGNKETYNPEWSDSATANVGAVANIIPVLQAIAKETEGKSGQVDVAEAGGVKDVAEGVYAMTQKYLEPAQLVVEKYNNWKDSLGSPVPLFSAYSFDYDAWQKTQDKERRREDDTTITVKKPSSVTVDTLASMPTPITQIGADGRLRVTSLQGSSMGAESRSAYVIRPTSGDTVIYYAGQYVNGQHVGGNRTFAGFCWAFVPSKTDAQAVKQVMALFEAATGASMRPATPKDTLFKNLIRQSTLLQTVKVRQVFQAAAKQESYVITAPIPTAQVSGVVVSHNGRPLVVNEDYDASGSNPITVTLRASYLSKHPIKANDKVSIATVASAESTETGTKKLAAALTKAVNTYAAGSDGDESKDDAAIDDLLAFVSAKTGLSVAEARQQAEALAQNAIAANDQGYEITQRIGYTPATFRDAMRKKNNGHYALIAHSGDIAKVISGKTQTIAPTGMRPFLGVTVGGVGASSGSQSSDSSNGAGDHAFFNFVSGVNQSNAIYLDAAFALSTDVTICGVSDTFGNHTQAQQNTPDLWLADTGLIQSNAAICSGRQVVIRHGAPLYYALFIVVDNPTTVRAALAAQGLTKFVYNRTLEEVVVDQPTAKKLHKALHFP